MTARIDKLYSELAPCNVFADIGCDHGYVAKMVLDGGLANKIYITDISARSLKKAEDLLADNLGKNVFSVVSDGFSLIPENINQALIAGMGGEEIIKIISSSQRPERLVLQPMKNPEKLRKTLVELGYKIVKDYTFECGKFYDLIVAEIGVDSLNDDEILFGRTNLIDLPDAFIKKIKREVSNINFYMQNDLSKQVKFELEERKKRLERFL